MESWKIYHVALKKLPQGKLQQIYRRSARLVNYWAADPKYCEETKKNPLDRIRIMLDELDNAGAGDYARAAIDYMADPLGGCFAEKYPAVSDKGCVDGESVDLSIAGGKLIDEIRFALADDVIDDVERMRIIEYARKLNREVDELLDAAGVEDPGKGLK